MSFIFISFIILFTTSGLVNTKQNNISQEISCSSSVNAFEWFTSTLNKCTNNPSGPILKVCKQLDVTGYFKPKKIDILIHSKPILARHQLQGDIYDQLSDFIDSILQAQLAGMGWHGATLGEMAETIDIIASEWYEKKPTGTVEWWNIWTEKWTNLASTLIKEAEELYSKKPLEGRLLASRMFLRAANYGFIAQHALPFSSLSLNANDISYFASFRFLDLSENIYYENVSIPFITDEGKNTTLPGYFLSCKGCSKGEILKPLIINTVGGFDWTLAGVLNLSPTAIFLDNGFAVLLYEGPGQGMTVRRKNNPLTFTPKWDRVLTAVSKFAYSSNLNTKWNVTLGLTARSTSFGGYLQAQACSFIDPKLIQGCIANPGNPNFAFSLNYLTFGQLIAPFQNVDKTLLSSLCGIDCPEIVFYFSHVNATYVPSIWDANLFVESITNSSCITGNEILSTFYSKYVLKSPSFNVDLFYLPFKMLSKGNTTFNSFLELEKMLNDNPKQFSYLIIKALNVQQQYRISREEINNTKVPIAIIGGMEDFVLESSSGEQYYNALSSKIKSKSIHYIASTESGGALHGAIGSYDVIAPITVEFAQNIAYGN